MQTELIKSNYSNWTGFQWSWILNLKKNRSNYYYYYYYFRFKLNRKNKSRIVTSIRVVKVRPGQRRDKCKRDHLKSGTHVTKKWGPGKTKPFLCVLWVAYEFDANRSGDWRVPKTHRPCWPGASSSWKWAAFLVNFYYRPTNSIDFCGPISLRVSFDLDSVVTTHYTRTGRVTELSHQFRVNLD